MKLAHDLLTGYLGIDKSYKNLLQHYFLPSMKKDVGSFVKSYHTCEVVINPNQVNQFKTDSFVCLSRKKAVDCVGPLPMTKKKSDIY